jgi:chromosome partitioning protein
VIGRADLVILPTRPSPHDLRAVGATVDIANRHGKRPLFVVNAATQRARITGEAAVALSQHGTVAPVTIHHRVDFAASMVDGCPSLNPPRKSRNSGSTYKADWRG